jgi:hypothetical protein
MVMLDPIVTLTVFVFAQIPFLPITVYTVFEAGETNKGLLVEPVLQEYVEAPLAVKVAVPLAHMVWLVTDTVGVNVALIATD